MTHLTYIALILAIAANAMFYALVKANNPTVQHKLKNHND